MTLDSVPGTIEAVVDLVSWSNDWGWGVPTLVGTLMVHAVGLHLIYTRIVLPLAPRAHGRHLPVAAVLGGTVVLLTALLAFAATVWGLLFLFLGALPSRGAAMLYSLNARFELDRGAEWPDAGRAHHRLSVPDHAGALVARANRGRPPARQGLTPRPVTRAGRRGIGGAIKGRTR